MIIGYSCGIMLFSLFYWLNNETEKEKEFLKDDGLITRGIIIKKINRKGGIDYQYQFILNGVVYKDWDKTACIYYLKDSIDVIYYRFDPDYSNIKCDLSK